MSGKTPIMILQEVMVKRKQPAPIYKFLNEVADDPGTFHYSVETDNIYLIGTGRTKKDAKQKAAFLALEELKKRGIYSYSSNEEGPINTVLKETGDLHSSAAELKDLCTEYQLPIPEYNLINECGPAHQKSFTICCKVGSIERVAVDTTKKTARQRSAALVLEYFSTNAPQRIADLKVSNYDGLISQNDFAKCKYMELTPEIQCRPNLGQIIADYPYAFKKSLEKPKLVELVDFLKDYSEEKDPVQFIEEFFKKIPLELHWTRIPSNTYYIMALQVPHTTPAIVMFGFGKNELDGKKLSAIDTIKYVTDLLTL